MANKIIAVLLTVLVLTGCATTGQKITCDVKPIAVPIVYSPAPPVVARPDLPHSTITSTDADGVVAKKYAASVEALLGYVDQLEDVVRQYNDIHNAYGTKASQVASDWKEKTGTELQIPTQPADAVTAKPPTVAPKLVVPPTSLH